MCTFVLCLSEISKNILFNKLFIYDYCSADEKSSHSNKLHSDL